MGHVLLSKLEVPLALQVLWSVLGPGAPPHIFTAFFSDLTKDPCNYSSLHRTCCGSRTLAAAAAAGQGAWLPPQLPASQSRVQGLGEQSCQPS